MSSNFNTANNEGLTPPATQGTPFSQTTQGILVMGENAFGTQEAQSPHITIPTSQQEETELRYNAQIDPTATKLADVYIEPVAFEGNATYVGQAGGNVEMNNSDNDKSEENDSTYDNGNVNSFEYYVDDHYSPNMVWEQAMNSLTNIADLFVDRKFCRALKKQWTEDYQQYELDEFAIRYKAQVALFNERYLALIASYPKLFRGDKDSSNPHSWIPMEAGVAIDKAIEFQRELKTANDQVIRLKAENALLHTANRDLIYSIDQLTVKVNNLVSSRAGEARPTKGKGKSTPATEENSFVISASEVSDVKEISGSQFKKGKKRSYSNRDNTSIQTPRKLKAAKTFIPSPGSSRGASPSPTGGPL